MGCSVLEAEGCFYLFPQISGSFRIQDLAVVDEEALEAYAFSLAPTDELDGAFPSCLF